MRFSKIEINHLVKSWVAVSIVFAMMLGRGTMLMMAVTFIIASVTVGVGFLLHELAHKFVAQKYGLWAEFRANEQMLLLSVIIAVFARFAFIAPGAVFIRGYGVSAKKNGKISIAGPLTNLALALIFLAATFITPIFSFIPMYGFQINVWLGFFNMIPFGNFDGVKVLRWNKKIYAATMAAFSGLMLLIYLPAI